MKKILRFVLSVFTCLVALFLLIATVLYLFEIELPHYFNDRICKELSSSNMVFSVENIAFKFPSSLKLRKIRILDLKKREVMRPAIAADCVLVELRGYKLPWQISHIIKRITITGLSLPRLPDGYYIPDSIEFPGKPDFQECDSPIDFTPPELDPFELILIRPDVLAVKPEHVIIKHFYSNHHGFYADDILLKWPDLDVPMSLIGRFACDFKHQRITGGVHGQARQANIRPMLTALDITNSWQFIDAFTGVTTPVDAGCEFNVNLRNNDLNLLLDLHPSQGRYRGIPFDNAHGTVDIRVFVRDTFQNAVITVGPMSVRLADGTEMNGSVIYENTNDVGFVTFDVDSKTSISNALAIANCMNDGTLDCLKIESTPHVTLKGTLAVEPENAAKYHHLDGTLIFDSGSFFSIPLKKAKTDFNIRGGDVEFLNASAEAPRGGNINGTGAVRVPEMKYENAHFEVNLQLTDIQIEDIAEVFGFNLGDRRGKIKGQLMLWGPLADDPVPLMKAEGNFECKDGHIAQMKIFAGLTDWMATNVPGFAKLVNQSDASGKFSLKDGRLSISNLLIEGDVFSIQSNGIYDIIHDNLDFTVRVHLFRKDSIINRLTAPITSSFSKLLLEFKVYGELDNPKWKYLSILEKFK